MSTRQQHATEWSNGTAARENDDAPLKIGVYGWRKRCLYFFVLLLTAAVIVNLALTIWILVVMRFNVDGMGKLRIKEDGIVMTEDGKAMFLGPLYASTVRSVDLDSAVEVADDTRGSLIIESDRYLFLQSGGKNGSIVEVNENDIEARTDSFVIRSATDKEVFRVNSNGVTISSEQLESTGDIKFDEIESHSIRSQSSLDLVAPSGEMAIKSSENCKLESLAGDINLQAIEQIRLQSFEDSIYLSASQVYLSSNVGLSGVMEVCVCPSGKLFFAPANATAPCQETSGVC